MYKTILKCIIFYVMMYISDSLLMLIVQPILSLIRNVFSSGQLSFIAISVVTLISVLLTSFAFGIFRLLNSTLTPILVGIYVFNQWFFMVKATTQMTSSNIKMLVITTTIYYLVTFVISTYISKLFTDWSEQLCPRKQRN